MPYAVRFLAIASWGFIVWLFLTWTVTLEQLLFGGVLSVLCGLALAHTGNVVGPWKVLSPRRFVPLLTLALTALFQIVRANIGLAYRIWRPSRPLRSGMVIVPTDARKDGELAAVGLLTSLVVDNQIVDLDRSQHVLQYHAVAVPDDRREITSPIEQLVLKVTRC